MFSRVNLSRLGSSILSLSRNKFTRQGGQIVFIRFIGLAVATLAQIYAVRQLGPEKLGISGMAMAVAMQASIFISFGNDALLVRQYREAAHERKALLETAFTARLLLTLLVSILLLAGLPFVVTHPEFLLPALCIVPLAFFQSNQAPWLLQATERLPAQYLATAISAVVAAALIFVFIKPSSPAGSDMAVAVAATAVGFACSWMFALRGLPTLRFDFRAIGSLLRSSGWLFASAIVVYGYTMLEQPLLGWLRSVNDLGVYRSALQVTNAVTPFVGMVSLLLYPKLITWKSISVGHLWDQQKKTFRKFLPVVIGSSALSFLVLPPVYPLVFGPRFEAAAVPCALLLTSKFVTVLNGIFGWGLWALKRDRVMLAIMTVVAVFSLSANMLTIPHFGMLGAATINLLSEVLILAICAWKMHRIATSPH